MTTVRRIFIIFSPPTSPVPEQSAENRLRIMELSSDTVLLNEDFGFVIDERDDAIYIMTEKASTIISGLLETGLSPERIYAMEITNGVLTSENDILPEIELFEQPDNFYVIYEFNSLDSSSNSYIEISNESSVNGTVMYDEESLNDKRLSI